MKNFNWEEFEKGETVVHCDTEEKANDFLKMCNDRNIIWYTNENLLNHNNFDYFKENTCYGYNNDNDDDYYCIYYISFIFCKSRHYNIIEWEIENNMKFNWADFKQGKFTARINNNNRQQFIKEIKKECFDVRNINCYNYIGSYYYIRNNSMYIKEFFDDTLSTIVDFVPNTSNKYELHITSDGIITNCIYKLNGEIVKTSSAKLNPADKFDFKEGAKICIDRVFYNNVIKKGTRFKVLNTSKYANNDYVCLDAYINKIGTFNYDCYLNYNQEFLSSGIFEKEYIETIDKKNEKIIWQQSEIEILEN